MVAGVYTHACVRETAVDAYERGFGVVIASDAVGSTEPAHAALTREWLEPRGAPFRTTRAILGDLGFASEPEHIDHYDPCRSDQLLHVVSVAGPDDVRATAATAAAAQIEWAAWPVATRTERLSVWADVIAARAEALAELIVAEVGKPRAAADDEVRRAAAHVRTAVALARDGVVDDHDVAPGVGVRARPVGVVGILMPWNNPLALACGKIAPALAFGNAVVFKPAPEGIGTARSLIATLTEAGVPAGLVGLVTGGASTGEAIVDEPLVAAIAVTGSIATGRALIARCGQVAKPLQAELGGNNAAIVLADADLDAVVPALIRGAFSFAGQRCTAIRRFVVDEAVLHEFEVRAAAVIDQLVVGDPRDPSTEVGPLISTTARDRVDNVVRRAQADGARLVRGGATPSGFGHGAWYAPTLLVTHDRSSAIVQEETFGPVAVVQSASGLDDALVAANGVAQGLVMAVCTNDAIARQRVLDRAEVGIVQIGPGPLPVHPDAPFGGWKASGFGPPEHGEWDATFATRPQAVYGSD